MGHKDGDFGHRLVLITHKDSAITGVKALKGTKVAHVTPSSMSGNRAPRALFKAMGVRAGEDYEVTYSGTHDNSVIGVVNKDYDAAIVTSTALARMVDEGTLKPEEVRIAWRSDRFASTSYGYVHSLRPELQRQIREAFFSVRWNGTGLDKTFGERAERFLPISFKRDWKVIRTIQRVNGVEYTQGALDGL